MPKYLWKASYTAEGARGIRARGGTARRDATAHALAAVGGNLEAFYFAFGETDAYLIGEVPDEAAAVAVSLVVNGSGSIETTTVALIEPETVDAAAQRSVEYTPPGG
jgi:uncharacterized protein with GYD domain